MCAHADNLSLSIYILFIFYCHVISGVLKEKFGAKRNTEKNNYYSPLTFSDHIQCKFSSFYIVFHLFSRILSHFRIAFVTDRPIFEYVRCCKTFRSFLCGCRIDAIDYLCRNSRVWNEKIRKMLRDDYRDGQLIRVDFDGGKFEFRFVSVLPRSRVVDVSAQQPVTFLTLKNTTTGISDKRQKM